MQSEHALQLKNAMEAHISKKFGGAIPPAPYITAFGIKTVDALLGGGIQSSAPISISSTPETGKSTICLQFASSFQRVHEDCIVLNINIEESAGGDYSSFHVETSLDQEYQQSLSERMDNFGIDSDRFINRPAELNVKEVFDLISDMVAIKRNMQKSKGQEWKLLIIWDSIAATPSSKDASAEDPKEVIGYKAREISFNIGKFKSLLSMERVTFILIDQVRSNIQIESPWAKAGQEKSVGVFGNYKAATSVAALHHHLRQWLFLSRGAILKNSDTLGVDGWIN